MRILALDPGMTKAHPMGWAAWDGRLALSGTACFQQRADDHLGVRLNRLRAWLETTCATLRPHTIAYEVPTVRGQGKGAITQLSAIGLVDMAACDCGADVVCCYPAALKKWATGHGRASKQDMVAEARARYGRKPKSDDEADALLLLAWARETAGATGKESLTVEEGE